MQLSELVSKPDNGFETILNLMNHPLDKTNRSKFIYIDKIINAHLNDRFDKLTYLHLHLPFFQVEEKNTLLEFLAVKLFLVAIGKKMANSLISDDVICYAIQKYNEQIAKKNRPIVVKEGAKGKNKKFVEQLRIIRTSITQSKEFWQKMSELGMIKKEFLIPNTLLLLSKNRNEFLREGVFKNFQFATSIEDKSLRECNVVLMNYAFYLSDIRKEFDTDIVQNLHNVVIVHSHKCDILTDFNFNQLLRYKKQKIAPFENLILLSFSREKDSFRLGKTIERLKVLSSKYRLPEKEKELGIDYWVHPSELGRFGSSSTSNIVFKGSSSNVFFDEVHDFIRENDVDNEIRELISIRMFNLYSHCCSQKFKEIVLRDIFNTEIEPKLIHFNTKKKLLELKKTPSFVSFKKAFENFLSFIHGNWNWIFGEIQKNNSNEYITFIISEKVYHHDVLRQELAEKIKQSNPIFSTWSQFFDEERATKTVIFLDYKDCGRNFDLYPSLLEMPYSIKHYKGVFLKFMFENRYNHIKYSYEKQLFKSSMNTPFRQKNMNWHRLQIIKPSKIEEDSLFDLESHYSSESDNRGIIINQKSYYPSQRFLIQLKNESRHFVVNAVTLQDEFIGQSKFNGLVLNDIIEQIDLFEFEQKEMQELKQIEDAYNLTVSERQGQLWRALLKRKENEGTSLPLMYQEINNIAITNNAKMVSENHFNNSWLRFEDKNLLPRSKSLFKSLAQYLGLSKSYIQLMLRKRASIKGTTRQNTDSMNELIEQIVDLNLLDDNIIEKEKLLQEVMEKQELNDYGLTIDDLREYVKFIKKYFENNQQAFN